MSVPADDQDIIGCFYGLLVDYFVIHKACGRACKGVPSVTDPDSGFIQCPTGCSGNWRYPDVLTDCHWVYRPDGTYEKVMYRDEFVLRTGDDTLSRPVFEHVWDYTTKPAHSKFVQVTDPVKLNARATAILADARAKTRRALARR